MDLVSSQVFVFSVLIINAIYENGGSASVEEITESVSKVSLMVFLMQIN